MPEFLLRYQPGLRDEALKMAQDIELAVSQVFFSWEVSWELRQFDTNSNQPDFAVTGWVTDNDDTLIGHTETAQRTALTIMRTCASPSQTVSCWWQRVKGKWDQVQGIG